MEERGVLQDRKGRRPGFTASVAHPGGHIQQTLDLRDWNSGTKSSWKPRFESDENIGDIEATGLDEMVQKEMQNEKRVKDGAQGRNM